MYFSKFFPCFFVRTPGINVQEYHGNSKKEKERALSKVRTRGGVLLITYGLVMTTKEVLSEKHGQEFVWVSGSCI